MSKGGKKDVLYIAEMLEHVILPYDPDKTLLTIFRFDGAENVVKASRILDAKFPQSYSLHGGEHVVSFFFSDIAKIKQIEVNCAVCVFNLFNALTKLYCFCRCSS